MMTVLPAKEIYAALEREFRTWECTEVFPTMGLLCHRPFATLVRPQSCSRQGRRGEHYGRHPLLHRRVRRDGDGEVL